MANKNTATTPICTICFHDPNSLENDVLKKFICFQDINRNVSCEECGFVFATGKKAEEIQEAKRDEEEKERMEKLKAVEGACEKCLNDPMAATRADRYEFMVEEGGEYRCKFCGLILGQVVIDVLP